MLGDLAAHVDDFFNTVSSPGTEIEFQAFSRVEFIERKQVSVGQVIDVDVVSNASSIVCRVVVAKQRDVASLAQCYLQNNRDQVGLWRVVFAQISNW